MTATNTRIKNFGIPNMLSILRIILIPVFIGVFFKQINDSKIAGMTVNPGRLVAAGVLIFSGFTDIIDGFIARKFHMITELGRVLDPLADKLTQAAVCICLVIWSVGAGQFAPVFLLVLFIIKEAVMIAAGANIIRKRKEMISSKWFGKLSTVIFYIVMITVIAYPQLPEVTEYVIIAVSLAFMLFSFIMYIPIFLELASNKDSNDEPVNN